MFTSAIFTLTLWIICSANAQHNVHKDMTIEELKTTFHVDSHHLVPEYEVISIHHHHVRKRSIERAPHVSNVIQNEDKRPVDGKGAGGAAKVQGKDTPTAHLRFHAFGKPMKLNLVRTEGLFKKGKLKIWTVEPNATAQHGLEYNELPETDEDIGEIYQDEANQAAILLRNDQESIIVEGSIGSDLVIRPIPERLRDSLRANSTRTSSSSSSTAAPPPNDDEEFLDTEGALSAEVSIDTGLPIRRGDIKTEEASHIVYKRKFSEDDSMSDYALMEPDHLAKRYRRSASGEAKSRNKREAPYTIYPEILVIVDYDGYRLHGGDNLQIKRYFVSFWNGVDLRYRLLKGPKVRISIAGIIISRGRDATPYLERNRVGRDAIDSAAALTDMGKYLFRERRLPVYDIAVAITKYDMCRRRKGGRCTKGTAGFAYVGGACVVNKRLEKVNSVAIIEDTGGFSGIIVAAHEVGHLLGAVHDGSPPPSYLGGPGAEKCKWTDGYIMSDLRHTERGFRWSSCSIQSFHHFLNGDTATCLYNAPHEDDSLPRVLPGKLLSLDAQCRRDRGTSACFKDDRVCAQLFCFDAASGYCVAYRPAAEGSACGDGQYCLNGRCVAEHENIIPDYTQNTPSYIRGASNQGRPLFSDDNVDAAYQPESPYGNNEYTTPQQPAPPSNYWYQQNQYQPQQPPQSPPDAYLNQNYYGASGTTSYTPTNNNYNTNNNNNNYYTTTTPFPSTTASQSTSSYSRAFSISTTRSPYNFKHFGTGGGKAATSGAGPLPAQSTTSSPTSSKFFQLRQTTKSPYDFADFGKSTSPYNSKYSDNVNNNYLKRSYNAASYFGDSSSVDNKTVLALGGRSTTAEKLG